MDHIFVMFCMIKIWSTIYDFQNVIANYFQGYRSYITL